MSELKPEAPSCKLQASSSRFRGPSAKLLKKQATSAKLQATSVKLQATRNKGLDLLTLIKFYGALFKGLNKDKAIQWMSFMEANLMG